MSTTLDDSKEILDIAVLTYLSLHNLKEYSFKAYARNRVELFGSESNVATTGQKKLRRRATNRLYYLSTTIPTTHLIRLLKERGFTTFAGTPLETQTHADLTNEAEQETATPADIHPTGKQTNQRAKQRAKQTQETVHVEHTKDRGKSCTKLSFNFLFNIGEDTLKIIAIVFGGISLCFFCYFLSPTVYFFFVFPRIFLYPLHLVFLQLPYFLIFLFLRSF